MLTVEIDRYLTLRRAAGFKLLDAEHWLRSYARYERSRPAVLWLGHADMQTTLTYLRADPSEHLATVTAVVPMPGRRVRLRAPDKLIASLHRR